MQLALEQLSHSSAHRRNGHKLLDVFPELSHAALDLTALVALFLALLPYASLTLCPSETILSAEAPEEAGSRGRAQGHWAQLGMVKDEVSRQYLVQGRHGSVLEETLEKVPSAQGSQGEDIRAAALAGEEQTLQEDQYGPRGSGKQPSLHCQAQVS